MKGAARELLAGMVDYAGLFPPAGLGMEEAVARYAAYRAGGDAWALGRFVVPAERLEEMADAVAARGADGDDRWPLSVLLGADPAAVGRIRALRHPRLLADVVELRADAPEEIADRLAGLPAHLTAYVEIPVRPDPERLVAAVAAAGARAKVRTGGVTPDLFPRAEPLLRFLRACVEADLPFKATAGLHHPVRGRYRLTYEPDSACVTMYGYLNLLLATALLRRGVREHHVAAALAETDASAFRVDAEAVSWREHRFDRHEVAALRERGMVSFGSCSFREPVDELAALASGARGAASTTAHAP